MYMTQRVLITGAASGIGLAFVKAYQALSFEVLACARLASDDLKASGAEVIEGVDVTDFVSITQLASRLNGREIDVLINCAGVLLNETLDDLDFARIQHQWEVNSLGPLRVTEALLPNLKRGAKIAMITSRMGSIADNTSGSRYGYRMSKAALNAASKSLAEDLKPSGIAVAILHPGLVATKMIGYHGDITPEQAAQRLMRRIEELCLDNSGTFWHSNGEVLPW
jgi:NAD(P)-dependent dehydrogenase (short-subunit alcohol dehydrogenase family)